MDEYLASVNKEMHYYKTLGEKALLQIDDEDIYWQPDIESNNIAVIMCHLHGNMLSRWTDLFTTDGEKPWRTRDSEFENIYYTREELMYKWNEGWGCLFNALKAIQKEDWNKVVHIRGVGHSLVEAINRQLAHYPYHIGQLVFIAKAIASIKWQSLSIPKKSNL